MNPVKTTDDSWQDVTSAAKRKVAAFATCAVIGFVIHVIAVFLSEAWQR